MSIPFAPLDIKPKMFNVPNDRSAIKLAAAKELQVVEQKPIKSLTRFLATMLGTERVSLFPERRKNRLLKDASNRSQ